MDVPRWIRAARKHAKLTQEQLGEHIGVGKQNVSHWENGRHDPSWRQLQAISSKTNYPLLSNDAGEWLAGTKQSQEDEIRAACALIAKLRPGQWEMVRARFDALPQNPDLCSQVLADVLPTFRDAGSELGEFGPAGLTEAARRIRA